MRRIALACALLLLLPAIGCGRYGAPRRPKPEAQAPPTPASQPAPDEEEREGEKPGANAWLGHSKPAA